MTTIVYRDGQMAADTRAYSGNRTPIGFKTKIHRLKDGGLLGVFSAQPGIAEFFRDWINDGENSNEIPDSVDVNLSALRVKPNGEVFFYSDGIYPSGPIMADWYAIGSGDQYAIGALSCGATADAAVMVAGQHDVWTGGQVQIMNLAEEAPEDSLQVEEAEKTD